MTWLLCVDFAELFKTHTITGILFFGWHLRTAMLDWLGSDWKGLCNMVGLIVELAIILLVWRFIRFIIRSFKKE